MSTEQENFDDLLRSKLSETEFEFNEANWDKAETLIIQAEKKRKRRLIAFIFFIGLTLGIGIMLPFISDRKENLVSENKNSSTGNNITTEKTEIEKTPSAQNTNNATDRENKQITTNETAAENTNQSTTSEKKETIPQNLKSLQKNNANDVVFSNSKNNKVHNTEEQKGRSEVSSLNNTPSSIKESETINKEEAKNNISKQNQPVAKTADTTSVLAVENNGVAKDTASAVKTLATKPSLDSTKAVAKETSTENKKEILKQTNVFSIDAGANYALGWTNNSTKEAAGFNGVFGFSLTHYFNTKWSVLLGAQYNSLAHLNYSNYTGSNTQYDFGYNQTKTVITPTILYYLAVPVKLQYHINDKNSFSIGVNTLNLLNTSSKVEGYTQNTFEGATSSNSVTKKTGYMDGFATWDIQPALAYRRRIIRCLSISAEVYYGLMDIKNNAAFGLIKSEHNNGLKLTLSYNLVHK